MILAHRDAAGRGARAELSGTAALLELARVLAAGETQRTIVLVSTSGGVGGDAGAADFAAHAGEVLDGGAGEGGAGSPIQAALVLGDLAGERLRAPLVASLSDGSDSAPPLLRSTLAAALAQQTGLAAGASGGRGGLRYLGAARAPRLPARHGRTGPARRARAARGAARRRRRTAPSGRRTRQRGAPGRLRTGGALRGVRARRRRGRLEREPSAAGFESGLPIQHKAIPAWALRLLVAALLLPALLVLGDGLARLRRRGEPVGRWILWTLACGLPFLACALFAIVLGPLGAIPAPRPPVSPAALPFDGAARRRCSRWRSCWCSRGWDGRR